MDVFDLVAKIRLDTTDFSSGLTNAESLFSTFGSTMGSLATGLVAGIASAIANSVIQVASEVISTTTETVKQIVKDSVEAYGEYEQLVGGMDTLFGESSEKIKAYADNAFQTVGMSANDYMEMATSFAAKLLNALDGDTDAAVEYTDKAIRQMRDNVNKLGTSAQMAENAYRGLARGEFRMLDNLQLGFAGTKQGMQDLLDKAKELSAEQGNYRDFSIESFADIIDAIGLVQDQLGITGTTELEAITTITGSASAFKAAWNNLLVALANGNSDLGENIKVVSDTLAQYAENIFQTIARIAHNFPDLIDGIAGQVMPRIAPLLEDITRDILKEIPWAVRSISAFLRDDELPQFMGVLTDDLIEYTPAITAAGVDLLSALIGNISMILEILSPRITELVGKLVQQLIACTPLIVDAGVNLIKHLFDSVGLIVEALAVQIYDIFAQLMYMISSPKYWAMFAQLGVKIGFAIISGLMGTVSRALSGIIQNFPGLDELLGSIILKGQPGTFSEFISAGYGALTDIYAALGGPLDAGETMLGFLNALVSPDEQVIRGAINHNGSGASGLSDYSDIYGSSGGRPIPGYVININGAVSAEDVANEVQNILIDNYIVSGGMILSTQ